MTLSACDQVAERRALGEPLGELSEHAESCEHCRKLVAVSSQLGATRHAVDPGLGFTARMTVGAQHRIAARRRQRLTTALAATIASGVLGVFFVTRVDDPTPKTAIKIPLPPEPSPEPQPGQVDEPDLAFLVESADIERTSRVSADWRHIKKPLRAYKKLLNEVEP
jgi:hypothetical protein